MTRKKILHFNFGTKINKGDAAIIFAIHDLFKKILPDYTLDSIPIQKLKISIYNHSKKQLIKKYKSNWKIFLFPIIKFLGFLKDYLLLKKINSYSLILIGGGGVYSGKWLLPLKDLLIKKIKPPIVVIGAGYNRSKGENQLSNEAYRSIITLDRESVLHSVRDQKTLELVRNKKNKFKARVIPDPAIFLNAELFSNVFIEPKKNLIGLNLAFHGWPDQEKYKTKIIDVYTQFIEYLKNQGENYQFLYFLHTNYAINNVGELQLANILKQKHPDLLIIDVKPRELKYLYSKVNFCVSMMLHSNILAYSTKTPYIGIAYDIKNYSFAESINHIEYLIDIQDLTLNILLERFNDLKKNQKACKQKFENFYLRDKKIMGKFLQEVKHILKN